LQIYRTSDTALTTTKTALRRVNLGYSTPSKSRNT